jgi:urease accessory protein
MQPAEILALLQLADSALPVGAAAHSFGLETLAEEGLLGPQNLEPFLLDHLEETGRLEAAFVRRAHTKQRVQDTWRELNAELSARKLARESREASLMLGRRLAELVNAWLDAPIIEPGMHYSIAFGVAGAVLRAPVDAVVLAYLQQSVSGLVSACQRLMPLGQLAASRIIWNLRPAIARVAEFEEVSCFTPLPELSSMRHRLLETRLFIS